LLHQAAGNSAQAAAIECLKQKLKVSHKKAFHPSHTLSMYNLELNFGVSMKSICSESLHAGDAASLSSLSWLQLEMLSIPNILCQQ
jgi:hypothetical protein